mmetsp:Transcript_18275/g.62866  ORF Transcript_18275/g.62866 Transcript_18275/m.62866 type:complete len:191 (+) Transcript_18275:1691-2263(+)
MTRRSSPHSEPAALTTASGSSPVEFELELELAAPFPRPAETGAASASAAEGARLAAEARSVLAAFAASALDAAAAASDVGRPTTAAAATSNSSRGTPEAAAELKELAGSSPASASAAGSGAKSFVSVAQAPPLRRVEGCLGVSLRAEVALAGAEVVRADSCRIARARRPAEVPECAKAWAASALRRAAAA